MEIYNSFIECVVFQIDSAFALYDPLKIWPGMGHAHAILTSWRMERFLRGPMYRWSESVREQRHRL